MIICVNVALAMLLQESECLEGDRWRDETIMEHLAAHPGRMERQISKGEASGSWQIGRADYSSLLLQCFTDIKQRNRKTCRIQWIKM